MKLLTKEERRAARLILARPGLFPADLGTYSLTTLPAALDTIDLMDAALTVLLGNADPETIRQYLQRSGITPPA